MMVPDSEWHAFLTKTSGAIVSICVGVIGKISYELVMKRKLTLIQWVAVVGISVFVGYISLVWCNSSGMQKQSYWIAPVATLLGERIMIYVMTNYRSFVQRFIDAFLTKK